MALVSPVKIDEWSVRCLTKISESVTAAAATFSTILEPKVLVAIYSAKQRSVSDCKNGAATVNEISGDHTAETIFGSHVTRCWG